MIWIERINWLDKGNGEADVYLAEGTYIPKDLKIRNGITEDFLDYRFWRFIIYF